LTSSVTWNSSNAGAATISTGGSVAALTTGTTTITATSSPETGSKVGSTNLTVLSINLPKTGQITSYATGDDGNLQRGIAWPSPRFTNPDGSSPVNGSLVIDQLTGLIWTADGSVPGPSTCNPATTKTWQGALDYVACLNNNNYLGHNNWRLPNWRELMSITGSNLNVTVSNAAWLMTQGFINVQNIADTYWSSSNSGTNSSYGVFVVGASFGDKAKTESINVWPVCTGPSGLTTLPKTGQIISYSVGDDGTYQSGITWPNPRFTNTDGTTPITGSSVIDQLTGLMWTKDGNAPGPTACVPSVTKTWQDALNYVACLNINNFLGYNDWRLPNMNELISTTNSSQSFMTTWLNSLGFINVQSGCYWGSSTNPVDTTIAVRICYDSGDSNYYKINPNHVWPVRAGL
jgi:hypothetical protein